MSDYYCLKCEKEVNVNHTYQDCVENLRLSLAESQERVRASDQKVENWREMGLSLWAQFAAHNKTGTIEYSNMALSALEDLEDALHRAGLLDAQGRPLWENLSPAPSAPKPESDMTVVHDRSNSIGDCAECGGPCRKPMGSIGVAAYNKEHPKPEGEPCHSDNCGVGCHNPVCEKPTPKPEDDMSKTAKPCQCGSPILRWVHHQPPRECGKVYEVVDDPVEIALMELSEFGWSSLTPSGEYRSQEELSGLLVRVAKIARDALAIYTAPTGKDGRP